METITNLVQTNIRPLPIIPQWEEDEPRIEVRRGVITLINFDKYYSVDNIRKIIRSLELAIYEAERRQK